MKSAAKATILQAVVALLVVGALQGFGSILSAFNIIEHQAQTLVLIVLFVFGLAGFVQTRSHCQFLIAGHFGRFVFSINVLAHPIQVGSFFNGIQFLEFQV